MPSNDLLARIQNDFVYHAPKPGQPELYEQIRGRAKAYAEYLIGAVPQGRELSVALTKLEEAVFWANAGIARGIITLPPPQTPPPSGTQ